jgi:hypothetical protein
MEARFRWQFKHIQARLFAAFRAKYVGGSYVSAHLIVSRSQKKTPAEH